MDPLAIDRSLERLSQVKDRWARLPIREKIRYLEQVRDLLVENADAWVAAGVQLKGLDPKAPIVGGEEWLGGPYPTAAWLTDMKNRAEGRTADATGEKGSKKTAAQKAVASKPKKTNKAAKT